MRGGEGQGAWSAELDKPGEKPTPPANLSPAQAEFWAQLAQDPRLQQFTYVAQKHILMDGVNGLVYGGNESFHLDAPCYGRAVFDARIKHALKTGKSAPFNAEDAGLVTSFEQQNDLDIRACAITPSNTIIQRKTR
jgi:hypothetical protein